MSVESGTTSGICTIAISTELSKMKAWKHTFSYYEPEDIAQEIYLMVHEASGRFDPDKVKKPMSFFNVHTENRLNNLRRDNRIIDDVQAPIPIVREDNSFAESVEMEDMVTFIQRGLPDKLLMPFILMMEHGSEGVSQYMKKNVRDAVSKLMEKYNE